MRIERSILIERPVEMVFAFVADPLNDPLWCPKVQRVEPPVAGDRGPGAEYVVTHRPVPMRPPREMRYTLVSSTPPTRLEWHEDDGHDRIAVTYVLEDLGGRTRFTQRDEAELGAPRVLQPLMRAGIGHDIAAQLKRLRAHLESA